MKYPRTPHLPWSFGVGSDDKVAGDLSPLLNRRLVVTEKLDGENTCISTGGVHARSEDGRSNPWQAHVRRVAAEFQWSLPEDMMIYGENLFAVHSIEYDRLTDFFYVFAVATDGNFESWDRVEKICHLHGLKTVPVLGYIEPTGSITELQRGLDLIWSSSVPSFGSTREGYVVRSCQQFPVADFHRNVMKWVRPNHVTTDKHWTKNWKPAKITTEVTNL